MKRFTAAASVAVSALAAFPAVAEVSEVRFAEGFGLAYLPITVMVDQGLIDKRARANGVGPVRGVLRKISGGPAMIDALLAGQVDFISGGVPPMINLWEKTRGNLNVRAIASMGDTPLYLNTVDPAVTSLKDLVGRGKIALPAVRISVHALTLQMAAEKMFGPGKHTVLDAQTVSMPHPEAMQALLSRRTEIQAHFATMPFIWYEAKEKGVRTILNSYDVLGGPHTGSVLYNSGRWKEQNPKVFASVAQAIEDAMQLINTHPRAAAEIYARVNPGRTPVEEIEAMLKDKNVLSFTSTPNRVMPYAEFMHRQGQIKVLPESWKALFWENMHGRPGS